MSFVVSGKIAVDGAQAKAELAATAAEAKKLGGAAVELDRSARQAGQGTRQLAAGATEAATDIRAMAGAAAIAEAQNQGLAQSSRIAAGAVGNMTAQFNDIFVMLAAGQNPLQLAIQQGTQISQAIGPMGAAGAVATLKDGLLAMVSPINLVTIGAIAAGAAAFQWFTGAGEQAITFDDALQSLVERTDAYREAAELANLSTDELTERFGTASAGVRQLIRDLAELELREAQRASRTASGALQEELQLFKPFDIGSQVNLAEVFDFSIWDREARKAINSVLDSFSALDRAGTLDQQIAAAEQLRSRFLAAAEASGQISGVEDQALSRLSEMILKMRELEAAQQQVAQAEFDLAYLEPLRAFLAQASDRAAEIASTSELLTQYQQEAELKRLMVEYGEDSAEVATFRVQAERDALQATIESLGASESMRDAILAAFDAANGVASVDMAGNISLAANEAGRLAQNMALVEGIRRDQARRPGVIFDPRDPRFDPVAAEAARISSEPNRTRTQASLVVSSSGTSGAGTGGGAARQEADAVERLIERKEQELALLGATNPVQREMIRNRELLATATEEQRARIDEVTAALEREKAMQEASDFFASSATDFLSSIVTGSSSASDALDGLIQKLIDAGIQALLLGEGPLAGILGISGGIFDFLGDAIAPIPGRADGGMIYGKGGPREDKELIMASPGEFMVNARATAKNRALLEFLNAGGQLPGFANGGAIGGAGASGAGAIGVGPLLSMPISIDARGAQRGAAEEIEAKLMQMMPTIEQRAVAAVARARGRGAQL